MTWLHILVKGTCVVLQIVDITTKSLSGLMENGTMGSKSQKGQGQTIKWLNNIIFSLNCLIINESLDQGQAFFATFCTQTQTE